MKKSKNQIIGIRACMEAIQAGKTIDKILIRKSLKSELFRELFKIIREKEIPFQYVPVEKLNKINSGNHQGVIGFISAIEYQKVENIVPFIFEKGENPFFVMLDRITDVRNMGAIARTAECAGVHALIIPSKASAQINSDAVKTSAGALNHIPVCRVNNLIDTIEFLKQSGIAIVAATEKAHMNYNSIDYNKPLAIVMGSEEDGISDNILSQTDEKVKIPIFGKVESLNVSVATGIMIYEVVKSRNIKSN